MRFFLFVTSPIYNPIFALIAIKSSSTLILQINLCYFHFGILSSLVMTFMSHLINYDFTLVLVQHFRVHKFIISQFHP